jgi:hypothetical protein
MKRVAGIGGIFFKAKDAKALQAWYKQHLGIDVQAWGGAAFDWTDADGSRLQEQLHGRSIRRKVITLLRVLLRSWSITAWKISNHCSKPCAKKAATYLRRSTNPSTESLLGSSIRKETRWNYGNRLPTNDQGRSANLRPYSP